jgi:hypothetical protein
MRVFFLEYEALIQIPAEAPLIDTMRSANSSACS